MNIKPYKILSYSAVRWSSIVESMARILVRWKTLITYFEGEGSKGTPIVREMKKPITKVYFQFLKTFLEKINTLNKSFKGKSPK